MTTLIGAKTGTKTSAAVHSQCRRWVKLRRTQYEHMFSELPRKADIAQYSRHVSKVPILLQNSFGIDQQKYSGRTCGERIMI
jgi:hypothetical protein